MLAETFCLFFDKFVLIPKFAVCMGYKTSRAQVKLHQSADLRNRHWSWQKTKPAAVPFLLLQTRFITAQD